MALIAERIRSLIRMLPVDNELGPPKQQESRTRA